MLICPSAYLLQSCYAPVPAACQCPFSLSTHLHSARSLFIPTAHLLRCPFLLISTSFVTHSPVHIFPKCHFSPIQKRSFPCSPIIESYRPATPCCPQLVLQDLKQKILKILNRSYLIKTERSIKIAGPKIWNTLPKTIKEKSEKVKSFKSSLKEYLLSAQEFS